MDSKLLFKMLIKLLIIVLLVLNLCHLSEGREMRVDSIRREGADLVLKRLLQYYREEGSLPLHSSVETESAEIPPPKFRTFNIDLNYGGTDEPEEEIPPFASYISEAKNEPNSPKPNFVPPPPPKTEKIPEKMSQDSIKIEKIMENFKNNTETQVNQESVDGEIEPTTVLPIAPINKKTKAEEGEENDDESETMHDEENDNDDEEDSDEQCFEGETKKLKCNSCVCVDGSFFCSKKKCGSSARPTNNILLTESQEAGTKSWSNKKKHANSTLLSGCSSGMTKSIDCNQCVCAVGKWACTKRSCIALSLREKASYTDGVTLYQQVGTLVENKEMDDDCSEGSTRQLDCNQCICHLNSWSCTKLQCGPTSPPPRPEEIEEACQKEGDVKSRECNICKCRNGIWVCTYNDCKALGDKNSVPPAFRSSSKITKNYIKARN